MSKKDHAHEPKRLKKPDNLDAGQKPKEKREPKEVTFPMEGFVNKYHFVRVCQSVLNAFGWKISGDRLKVELDLKDDALVVRKKDFCIVNQTCQTDHSECTIFINH